MKQKLRNNLVLLLFFASALIVLGVSLYSGTLMRRAATMLEDDTEQRLLAVARLAAEQCTVAELDALWSPSDMDTPLYAELKARMADFAEENDILYGYYLRPVPGQPGMLQFILDGDYSDETVGLDTEAVAVEPAPEAALAGGAACAGLGIYSDSWPGLLSSYAPVYAEDGSIYCIAGVDMSDEQIMRARQNISTMSVIMFFSMVLVVTIGFLSFSLYRRKAIASESASVAKSEFLSRMSHEIRTPMNAIIGLCRMARRSEDIDTAHRHLDGIDDASSHLLQLINDILDLSKIESGKIVLEESAIDLRQEINGLCGIIQPQVRAKRQFFRTELADSIPQYVYCDCFHMGQVLLNLLSNAVKFTPEEGEITLRVQQLEHSGDQCCLEFRVRDNGIGIEQAAQARLFEPFEQASGGTTRKYGGTGLGLSIARQLVNMMGGDIRVDSALGKGSEFSFHIWVRMAESAVSKARVINFARPDIHQRRILVVEDSEINRLVAEDVLKGMGAQVDFAENGLIGVEKYQADPDKYDFVFMDIQMPVMDGYEATRRIRSSRNPRARTVPIIAMTANVFKEDVERALAAGMNAHVGKPFEVDQVEQAIYEVLLSEQA